MGSQNNKNQAKCSTNEQVMAQGKMGQNGKSWVQGRKKNEQTGHFGIKFG